MGEVAKGMFLMGLKDDNSKQEDKWVIMEGDDHDQTFSNISPDLSLEGSSTTTGSTSSSELIDDASSSSSSNSNGPLYELSELMAQLPVKRGLSKYFQGKSQSFTSLSRVKSIEDLAKKEKPYRRKKKSCKSYGNGLDAHRSFTLPKATISKKVSRGSFSCLSLQSRKSNFLNSRPPPIPPQK